MIPLVILNIVLAGTVLLVIIGGLGWSIATDRSLRGRERAPRRTRRHQGISRHAVLQQEDAANRVLKQQ